MVKVFVDGEFDQFYNLFEGSAESVIDSLNIIRSNYPKNKDFEIKFSEFCKND